MIGIQQVGVLLLFGLIGAILWIGIVELVQYIWRNYVNKR
jgi:hypothetical protein